jgi:hypothetical protein
MKIWIYWSESNSWIYICIVLNKKKKNYLSEQSFTGLGPKDRWSSWGLLMEGEKCMVESEWNHVLQILFLQLVLSNNSI